MMKKSLYRRAVVSLPRLLALSAAIATQQVLSLNIAWSKPATTTAAELPALCEQAAHIAGAELNVPVSVMRAITLTETGRKFAGHHRPWPWTVNMEGTGKWFDKPEDAQAYVDTHFQRGARSFDVGCFQINYRWHGQAFASIEEMFDPMANARYAARFLKRLYSETGDWSKAAGAYHSRTPEYANRYRQRFDKLRARFDGVTPPPVVQPTRVATAPVELVQQPRRNTFPLLQSDAATGRLGSLVPIGGRVAGGQLIALN